MVGKHCTIFERGPIGHFIVLVLNQKKLLNLKLLLHVGIWMKINFHGTISDFE